VTHVWDLDHDLVGRAGVSERVADKHRAYVFWSGGLDSTTLIYLLLTRGYKVCAGRVLLDNNGAQLAAESVAIEHLTALLNRDFPERFTCEEAMKVEVKSCCDEMILSQPVLWVTAAAMVAKDCEVVAFGYVMHDCAISFLPEIVAAYEALTSFRCGIIPRIVFPFRKNMKEELIHLLPEEYQARIVWCERPTKRGKVCGSCKSCQTMKGACPALYYKRAPHAKKPDPKDLSKPTSKKPIYVPRLREKRKKHK